MKVGLLDYDPSNHFDDNVLLMIFKDMFSESDDSIVLLLFCICICIRSYSCWRSVSLSLCVFCVSLSGGLLACLQRVLNITLKTMLDTCTVVLNCGKSM